MFKIGDYVHAKNDSDYAITTPEVRCRVRTKPYYSHGVYMMRVEVAEPESDWYGATFDVKMDDFESYHLFDKSEINEIISLLEEDL